MLENCGFEVTETDSGKSAVELAESNDFFMIFIDINMPEMDGYTACELIRNKNKSVPVIALSADKISENDSRFTESGMSGFLLKPLQSADLKKLLNKYTDVDDDSNFTASSESVFDYNGLVAVMKDEKAVLKILEQFINIHGRDSEMLAKNIDDMDFRGARAIIHNIKGISGNMFCKKLYRVSCNLSSELKQECSYSLEKFMEIWDITLNTLKEYHDRLIKKYPSCNYKSDWNTVWKNFLSLACEFDISAVDIFTENMQLFMENMDYNQFMQLKKAVLDYDFLWISENIKQ